jgi:hypothetical protein
MHALLTRSPTWGSSGTRECWRDGAAAVFPPGTYWLTRFASVPVVET